MQRAAEVALQDGLARYESSNGRARFSGAEMNLGDVIKRIEARQKPEATRSVVVKPAWRQALERARLPLYDVHWNSGVVVEKAARQGRRGCASACATGASCRSPMSGRRCAATSISMTWSMSGWWRTQGPRRCARGTARAADRARRGAGAGEQDRAHPGDGRRLLLSAEPAQPRGAGRAPAGLRPEAADVPRGARQGPATEHARCWTTTSRCRRSAAAAMRARRTTGRRRTTAATARVR